MKLIKLFEDFDTDDIVRNIKQILSEIENFGFNTVINSNFTNLDIEISKKRNEEIRVFQISDIFNILEDFDNYLYLGEGLKCENIYLETTEGDKQLKDIKSLKRERIGIISILISYTK